MVHRGFFFLEQLLGVRLPPPPDNVAAEGEIPAGVDPTKLTTRQEFEYLHSSTPQCYGCHVKLDPVGGAFENYDAIGRFRLFERESIRIDSSGKFEEDGIDITYNDTLEFIRGVSESERIQQRFQEVMIGYFLGVDEADDMRCELEEFAEAQGEEPSVIDQIQTLSKIKGLIHRVSGGAP